jgi:putative transposase
VKQTRFNEQQIIKILKEAEAGLPVPDIYRQYGIGKSTFYKWKSKYGGLEASELAGLKTLEAENRRLKQMYAELSLEHQVLKEIVEKKLYHDRAPKVGGLCYRAV